MLTCPICNRELGTEWIDEHHLIPKTFKGKETIKVHRICHEKIHSTFSEKELYNYYHTIERLIEHEEMQKFIRWVSKKPINYFDHHKDTKERKRKRK